MKTLPDYLEQGLDIVFVGINPGLQSARVGHYFATPTNRFWTALNRSGLLATSLDAASDHMALLQGVGFTDVVKRPTRSASELKAADYREWAPRLKLRLLRYDPLIVCFQGATAYKNYLKHAENAQGATTLGEQRRLIGDSAVFVVPNPSPANAAYSIDALVSWYRRLAKLRDGLKAR